MNKDFLVFTKKIEELLLDDGLLKAMKEVEDDNSVNYEDVKELIDML